MRGMRDIHIIYLDDGVVLLSKRPYASWREIQAEYSSYMASLGPWGVEEVIDFFRTDLGPDDRVWPMDESRIRAFAASEALVLR